MSSPAQLSVVHVASGDLWAGAEVQLYQLACALERHPDVCVNIVLLNDGLLAERLRKAAIPVTVLPESSLSTWQILRGLITFLRRTKPDVVHTHRQKENVLGSIAAKIARVPRSLRTVHGASEFEPTGIGQRINRWLDSMTGRYLQHGIVMVTDELKEKTAGAFHSKRTHVINNGIACPVVVAEADPVFRQPDKINVCFAGRLTPVKRIDIFADIAASFAQQGDTRFHCHVFGDGPLLDALTKQVEQQQTGDLLTPWGFCDDMPNALNEMDVLVMTSDHEGLPLIMLEAMALGVPVVAHAVGGMPEVLADGVCGVLVSDHSGEGFANALLEAYDAGEFDKYASRAKARFESRYTIDGCADRYAGLYHLL